MTRASSDKQFFSAKLLYIEEITLCFVTSFGVTCTSFGEQIHRHAHTHLLIKLYRFRTRTLIDYESVCCCNIVLCKANGYITKMF